MLLININLITYYIIIYQNLIKLLLIFVIYRILSEFKFYLFFKFTLIYQNLSEFYLLIF